MSRSRRRVEAPGICFTFFADSEDEWPRPFSAAARTVLLPSRSDPSILVLGWGLGAMGSRMAQLRPEARILGVELDRDLYRRAQRELPQGARLELAEAASFLRRTRRRFDLVLDDCFELIDGDAVRPRELHCAAPLARARLGPGGIYVRNHLPPGDRFRRDQIADVDESFELVRLRRFRDWDNVLVVASDRRIDPEAVARL